MLVPPRNVGFTHRTGNGLSDPFYRLQPYELLKRFKLDEKETETRFGSFTSPAFKGKKASEKRFTGDRAHHWLLHRSIPSMVTARDRFCGRSQLWRSLERPAGRSR